jgi:C1A family cysteine protease
MARRTRRYGWVPDLPDHRDHLYAAPPAVLRALPTSVDLRTQCPPVLNQGDLGSCTANAIANAHRFDQLKQSAQSFLPSRLFIYYNERVMEGTVESDAGAMLRDGVKSIAKQGVCPERDWPYVPSKFATKPPARAYAEAKRHQAIEYQRVTQTLSQMRGCIADGFPFIFGFTVYESFESEAVARTGRVPMPGPGEGTMGGHAMMAVGYRDASQGFLAMNSWSTGWGDGGFCTMPYAYLVDTSLAADLWTIRIVET